jgi:hypothetical protein
LLKANPDKIGWCSLSYGYCTEAVELLKANPNKIDWCYLSSSKYIYQYVSEF